MSGSSSSIDILDTNAALRDRPAFIVLMTTCLYFAQGLPLGFVFGAYPVLMRSVGVSLGTIAWIPLLGLPWVLKFLWGSTVDNRWSAKVGRRRTWLISQQALMIVVMGSLAFIPNTDSGYVQLGLLALASLFSATQDVATDGLAAERLKKEYLSAANALSVGGMASGFLFGSAGVLIAVDHSNFHSGVLLLLVLLAVTAIPTLLWREKSPNGGESPQPAKLSAAIRRPNAGILLALALVFASAHSMDGALSKLYLVDRGLSLSRIGSLDGVAMASMALLGCSFATVLMRGPGAWICITAGLVLVAGSALFWLVVSYAEIHVPFPVIVVARLGDGIGMGLASSAIFTIVMQFASGADQTGTDVTIFKSANALGEIGSASAATAVASWGGFSAGFALAVLAAIVAMALTLIASRRIARPGSVAYP